MNIEKIDKLIEVALKNKSDICFSKIECLGLKKEELNYLIKKLDENKINISKESIDKIINGKILVSDDDLFIKDSVKQYFKEVGEFLILSECEEKILFYEYKKHKSLELKQKLVSFYLRVVVSVAVNYEQRIKNTSYDFLDIIQEGNKGLIRAIDKFDITLGTRFSGYASWWIRQAIENELMENTKLIRVPIHLVEVYNKILKYKKTCGIDNLSDLELAKAIGTNEKRVKDAQKIVGRIIVSLDEYIYDSEDFLKLERISIVEPTMEEKTLNKLEFQKIDEIMRSVLTEKEFFVVSCKNGIINEINKYPDKKTLTEVGRIMGLTRERIRQILDDAYKKIRTACQNEISKPQKTKK